MQDGILINTAVHRAGLNPHDKRNGDAIERRRGCRIGRQNVRVGQWLECGAANGFVDIIYPCRCGTVCIERRTERAAIGKLEVLRLANVRLQMGPGDDGAGDRIVGNP